MTTVSSSADIRRQVDEALRACLDERIAALDGPYEPWSLRQLKEFVLTGGKRTRSVFCYWGWNGATRGHGDDTAVTTLSAALELSHAFALIQDDIIDQSSTRRERPSLHCRLAEHHRAQGWAGDADRFGVSLAIELADLCLQWSGDVIEACSPSHGREIRAVADQMIEDAVYGNLLETTAQARRDFTLDRCLVINHYKTGRYIVAPALAAAAALADAAESIRAAYWRFGVVVGEGYQMRDDLLGAFGDPAVTGKPATDDFRDGKPTVLVAYALQKSTGSQADRIQALYGNPALTAQDVEELRFLLRTTGAVTAVEEQIGIRLHEATLALEAAPMPDTTRRALAALAAAALRRSR